VIDSAALFIIFTVFISVFTVLLAALLIWLVKIKNRLLIQKHKSERILEDNLKGRYK
jgi:hypothetical protein